MKLCDAILTKRPISLTETTMWITFEEYQKMRFSYSDLMANWKVKDCDHQPLNAPKIQLDLLLENLSNRINILKNIK